MRGLTGNSAGLGTFLSTTADMLIRLFIYCSINTFDKNAGLGHSMMFEHRSPKLIPRVVVMASGGKKIV